VCASVGLATARYRRKEWVRKEGDQRGAVGGFMQAEGSGVSFKLPKKRARP
jgi:hypothetical protein